MKAIINQHKHLICVSAFFSFKGVSIVCTFVWDLQDECFLHSLRHLKWIINTCICKNEKKNNFFIFNKRTSERKNHLQRLLFPKIIAYKILNWFCIVFCWDENHLHSPWKIIMRSCIWWFCFTISDQKVICFAYQYVMENWAGFSFVC